MNRSNGGRLAAAVVGAVVVAVGVASPAYAAAPDPTARLNAIVDNATGWLMGILAGVATFFFTVGAVRHVMAGGDPGEVEKAKSAYKSAGIGYLLAALAPIVVPVLRGILGVS